MGTIQKKAPRQPIIEPKKLPNGAAIVVASAFPPFNKPSALGTESGGTSRMTIDVEIAQKPPITTPKIARPNINKAAEWANVMTMPETIISRVSNKMI